MYILRRNNAIYCKNSRIEDSVGWGYSDTLKGKLSRIVQLLIIIEVYTPTLLHSYKM